MQRHRLYSTIVNTEEKETRLVIVFIRSIDQSKCFLVHARDGWQQFSTGDNLKIPYAHVSYLSLCSTWHIFRPNPTSARAPHIYAPRCPQCRDTCHTECWEQINRRRLAIQKVLIKFGSRPNFFQMHRPTWFGVGWGGGALYHLFYFQIVIHTSVLTRLYAKFCDIFWYKMYYDIKIRVAIQKLDSKSFFLYQEYIFWYIKQAGAWGQGVGGGGGCDRPFSSITKKKL